MLPMSKGTYSLNLTTKEQAGQLAYTAFYAERRQLGLRQGNGTFLPLHCVKPQVAL